MDNREGVMLKAWSPPASLPLMFSRVVVVVVVVVVLPLPTVVDGGCVFTCCLSVRIA